MNGRSENEVAGRRMRTCESCQVGLGIVDLREFVDRFIYRNERCPRCGRGVFAPEPPKEQSDWIPVVAVSRYYSIEGRAIRRAASRGLLERKKDGHRVLVLAYQVEELITEGLLGERNGERTDRRGSDPLEEVPAHVRS